MKSKHPALEIANAVASEMDAQSKKKKKIKEPAPKEEKQAPNHNKTGSAQANFSDDQENAMQKSQPMPPGKKKNK